MKSEILKSKSVWLLLLSAFQLFSVSAFGAPYVGVYASTNYVILPGFTIPFSQITGGTNGYSNFVYRAEFLTVSNNLATNSAARSQANSNSVVILNNLLSGTSTYIVASTNSFSVSGLSNTVSGANNSHLFSGKTNTLYGSAQGTVILGGIFNWDGYGLYSGIVAGMGNNNTQSPGSVILGGANNYNSGTTSSAIHGEHNAIFFGSHNTIINGVSNTIGQIYGWNNVFAGPTIVNNAIAGGVGAWPLHNSTLVLADDQGPTSYLFSTQTNQALLRYKNGVGINVTNTGTNALAVGGNADASSMSIGGVSLFTLFSPTATSNALSALWYANLNTTSNGLLMLIQTNIIVINNASNKLNTTSNALQSQITTVSNLASTVASKAFSAQLPATYASIGIGFSTPLMPDGNYSVCLTPQDQTTAEALLQGLGVWVDTKNNSGFTLHASYSTNAYALNFECIVKENTQ